MAANHDAIAVLEKYGRLDSRVIHVRTIAAAEVSQQVPIRLSSLNDRVIARDQIAVE